VQETQPEIFIVARPVVDWPSLYSFLDSIGGTAWVRRILDMKERGDISDGEALVEFMARSCYKSFDVGLNANVTKVRTDSTSYFRNILSSEHGSVLEHSQYSFMFRNVSRVFTHELVRHRAGVAISQESLRYVRLTDIGFRIPDVLANGPDIVLAGGDGEADTVSMQHAVISIVEKLEEFQRAAAEAFGLDDEGVPFHYKKEVTSALRRLAPIGLSTNIGWSANIRTLRFVLMKRTEAGAEEEIRLVFDRVARLMIQEAPYLFSDFHPVEVEDSDIPAWVPEFRKV
jgi:thymidylate synthase (FAD)